MADTDRVGQVTALGMDETLFAWVGVWRRQLRSTSVVDVGAGAHLDVVLGRGGTELAAWLAARGEEWLAQVEWATLDLSSPYRAVFDTMLPDATQIADRFHLIKLAKSKLGECRRREPSHHQMCEKMIRRRHHTAVVIAIETMTPSELTRTDAISASCHKYPAFQKRPW